MLTAGTIVIAHFVNPTEKYWGLLLALDTPGLSLRGISVASYDDWLSQLARDEDSELGLSTMFVPLQRVERIFLDEPMGAVESYSQRFERRVGVPIGSYLGLAAEPQDLPS